MKQLSTPYQIMIIISITLAVYYPTLFAEVCLVDDYGAISCFLSKEVFLLKDIFIPHSVGGGYYRPLIALSYILDKQLWFLHERLMHLESVVAHSVNGLLVFFICQDVVYLELKRRKTWLPLVAALMFVLHPITTESVNWISGRTDIMMSTFVLVSVLCTLRYIQSQSKLQLVVAIISGIVACLAKEAAFGYLIGLPLLALYQADSDRQYYPISSSAKVRLFGAYYLIAFLLALFVGSYWVVLSIAVLYLVHIYYNECEARQITLSVRRIVTWCAIAVFAIAVVIGLSYYVRSMVFTSSAIKIGQTITLMLADLNYTISLFLGAVGFYVRKFFYPLPLNFFVLEIDPLYDFIGISVLLLLCNLIFSKKLPAIFFLLGMFLLLPALPFAFGTIAWTAYAERYIYLSSAFWIIAFCLWGRNWLDKNPVLNTLVTTFAVIICLASAIITFRRNIVWQSNVTLMSDTVAQTPQIRKLRNIYIKALLDHDQTNEALEQYQLAASVLPSSAHDEQAGLMIGEKLISEHRYKEALQLYKNALQRTHFKSEPLLSASIGLLRSLQEMKIFSELEKKQFSELQKIYSVYIEDVK